MLPFLYLLFTVPLQSAGLSPAATPGTDSARVEAINVLQGAVSDAFLPEVLVRDVSKALRLIRERHPSIRDVHFGHEYAELILYFNEPAWRTIAGRRPRVMDRISSTGLPGVDTIASRLQVTSFVFDTLENTYEWRRLKVQFKSAPNVPVLARIFEQIPEVEHAGSEVFIGSGDRIGARLDGGTILISFYRKWGDCPAGCIYARVYEFAFDRKTGLIRKLREEGDPLPRPDA